MAVEILMITHNRLEYLKKAVAGVLAQDYPNCHLTIWDNGSDFPTTEYLSSIKHEKVSIILSRLNNSLSVVTNDIFGKSKAEFVGKVDSDTIVPPDWASRLIDAHQKYHFGFIGGFHFKPEDIKDLEPNIEDFNGVKIWRKHHIGGCSFVIRREYFKGYEGQGVMGLSEYQAEMGLVNGYLWDPILWVDHMEDARSKHYINSPEYNEYKIKTRGIDLEHYQASIANPSYLKENTK